MSQKTRNDLLSQLEEIVGAEEVAEYSTMPKKAVEAILSAKKAEAAAKADAEAAKATPRSGGRQRTKKGPQLTKEARALRRWMRNDSDSLVNLVADLAIQDPSLSEEEIKDLLGCPEGTKITQYLGFIRAAIRAAHNNGVLAPEYFIEIHNTMTEKEESE